MDSFSQLVTYINLLSHGEKLGERAKYVSPGQRLICRNIVVYTCIEFDFTLVGSLLDTRVALLTLTRVATRLESSRTIYHIDYILHSVQTKTTCGI